MKNDPEAFVEPREDWMEQQAICMKWMSILGIDLEIDLRAKDYTSPFNNPEMETEYDADMNRLHNLKGDPYDAFYEAAVNSNLI